MHFSSLVDQVRCRTVSIVLYSARLAARFGNVIGSLKPCGPRAQFICVWASHWLMCMYSTVYVYDLLSFLIFTFCLGRLWDVFCSDPDEGHKQKRVGQTVKGIFRRKFNPWSNTPWHRVRPSLERLLVYKVLATTEKTAWQQYTSVYAIKSHK